MTTPKKAEIVEKAKELFIANEWRNGNTNPTNPEYSELLEGGWIAEAQSILMQNEATRYEEYMHNETVELTEFHVDIIEALKSGVYVSGTTGTGKSDVAMYIVERLMKEGITVFVFDPSQDWRDRSSVPHCVTVYDHLDLTLGDREHSTVFDISRLTIPDQKRLVEWFCKTIFEHQARILSQDRKQYFVIFEEAHTYLPQGCMKAKAYQNTVRLLTQGRNYKVRMGIITQFASMVDKNAMRYMKQRYFGSTDEPNDVSYIRTFLNQNADTLKTLDAGQFLYYHSGKITKIAVEPYQSNSKPKTERSKIQQIKRAEPSNAQALSTLLFLLSVAFVLGAILL